MSEALVGSVLSGSKGVSAATITAVDGSTTYSTTSGSDGDFSLNLPGGTYKLTASKSGYVTQTMTGIVVNSVDINDVEFDLTVSSTSSSSSASEVISVVPPSTCTMTIAMDQSSVDAAASAGEYVTIVQSISGDSVYAVVWV